MVFFQRVDACTLRSVVFVGLPCIVVDLTLLFYKLD